VWQCNANHLLFLQSADLQFFDPLQQTPTKQPLQNSQHEHEKKVLHTQVRILSPASKFHMFLSITTGIVNIGNETHIFSTLFCHPNLYEFQTFCSEVTR
jgi:hypothetical protein